MTNLPPEPKPDDENPRDDEGQMGFILGPRDKEDGTPIKWTPEVIRRLQADWYHAKELAKKHGLELEEFIESDPTKIEGSERSKEITRESNPEMADAAARIRASRQTLKCKQPDGTEIEATKTEIELSASLALEQSVKAIASLIAKPFKWSGRIALRFGKWAKATAAASNDEREG